MSTTTSPPPIEIDAPPSKKPVAPKPTAQQAAIIKAIKTDRHQCVLITGDAGTGKSFLLEQLRREIHSLDITATTGIAALNVGGTTLHRFAGLGMNPESTTARAIFKRLQKGNYGQPQKAFDNIRGCSRLAIDEISMQGAELFDLTSQLFQLVRDRPEPFGGVQVIAIGDFLQAPPVNAEFAFKGLAWAAAGFKTHQLTEVIRQADHRFAQILAKIRRGGGRDPETGAVDLEVADFLRERLAAKPDDDKAPVILDPLNRNVDTVNAQRLADLPGEVTMRIATEWGKDWAKEAMDRDCRMPKKLYLKPGARVMLLQNIDPEGGLANGSLGTIENIKPSTIGVRFDAAGLHDVPRWTMEKKDGKTVVAERTQFPLRLAWAITIHKSQGQTLDKVAVNLADCFAPGMAYVALSRCRTADGLFITSSKRGCIKADAEALAFYGL